MSNVLFLTLKANESRLKTLWVTWLDWSHFWTPPRKFLLKKTFFLRLPPPLRIFYLLINVTSLTFKANVLSTNTSHTWIDIVHTHHERKGRFLTEIPSVKSPLWHWVSSLSQAVLFMPQRSFANVDKRSLVQRCTLKAVNVFQFFERLTLPRALLFIGERVHLSLVHWFLYKFYISHTCNGWTI